MLKNEKGGKETLNVRYKRASFAFVIALALLLLTTTAVQAYHKDTDTISARVYTHTYIDDHLDEDVCDSGHQETSGPVLQVHCRSSSSTTGGRADASAKQHVTRSFVTGKQTAVAEPEEGHDAYAYSNCTGDPVGEDEYGFELYGITLKAHGSGQAKAKVTLIIYDATDDEVVWEGTAEFEAGTDTLSESGTWGPKKWSASEHGAHFPMATIKKAVAPGHTIYTYCNVAASVTGGGRAEARVIEPIGGIAFPVDKLALLAPYIALAVAIVSVTLGAVYSRKHWLVPKL